MDESKIKVGIIGLGFGQYVHLPAFQRDPRCEVIAVCSPSPGKASQVAQANDIQNSFQSWSELFALEELDAISIAVPPNEQPRILAEAMHKGLAVFCEKPLAADLKQYRDSLSALKTKNPVVMDFEFPFISAFQSAKDALQNDSIGQIASVNVLWSCSTRAIRNNLDSWKTRRGEGGVAALFVSHCFLYLEWFAGPLKSIQAILNGEPGRESHVSITGQFQSGAILTLSVCAHATPGTGHRVEIFGDQGSIILENSEAMYMPAFSLRVGRKDDSEFDERLSAPRRTQNQDGRVEIVGKVVSHFLDCVADDSIKSWPSLEQGKRVQILLDAVARSHSEKTVVSV